MSGLSVESEITVTSFLPVHNLTAHRTTFFRICLVYYMFRKCVVNWVECDSYKCLDIQTCLTFLVSDILTSVYNCCEYLHVFGIITV